MFKTTLKLRIWVILACLPAFCLSSAATGSPGAGGWDDSGAGSTRFIHTFEMAGAPSVLLFAGERTRLKSFDSLFSVLYEQADIVFDRESSPFRSHDIADFTTCTDLSVLPIRAPPFRACKQSIRR